MSDQNDFKAEKFKKIDPLDKIKDRQIRYYAKAIRTELNPRHKTEKEAETSFQQTIIPVSRKERAIIDVCISKIDQLGEYKGIFKYFLPIITGLQNAKEISYGDLQLCLLLSNRIEKELLHRRDEDTRIRGFIKKIFNHIVN